MAPPLTAEFVFHYAFFSVRIFGYADCPCVGTTTVSLRLVLSILVLMFAWTLCYAPSIILHHIVFAENVKIRLFDNTCVAGLVGVVWAWELNIEENEWDKNCGIWDEMDGSGSTLLPVS